MTDAPKQLAHYKIVKQLGAGGMADVYDAFDEHLQRHIALKVLPLDFARSEDRVKRFDREVLATANLNHPNIVTVYNVGKDQGYAFYTMELLPGGSLKEKINAGLSVEEVLDITKQIASALAYAHKENFVHRDLKPDNILFDAHGKAIVTDLGIAKIVGKDTTQLGMSLGTPYYMSPEQALAKTIDGRSDLYSLGVLIYRMLTQKPLFDAEDSQAICLKHIQEPPPALPHSLSAFQPILDKLLAKQPADRYTNADELILALDTLDLTQADKTVAMESSVKSEPGAKTKIHSDNEVTVTALSGAIPEKLDSANPNQSTENTKKNSVLVFAAIGFLLVGVAIAGGHFYFTQNKTANTVSPLADEPKPVPEPNVEETPSSPELAILHISSAPEAAEVIFNGESLGITPLTLENLPSGKQSFEIKKRYYKTEKVNVELTNNKLKKSTVSLSKGNGSLTILSSPDSAQVFIEGKQHSSTTPLSIDKIQAGEYTIVIRQDDAIFKQRVSIDDSENKVLRASLTKGKLISFGEKWYSSDELLELAELDIKARRVLLPEGQNALEKLRAIIAADQGNTQEAKQKLGDILQFFRNGIIDSIESGHNKDAEALIELVETHVSEFKNLEKLKARLNQSKKEKILANKEKAYMQRFNAALSSIKQQKFTRAKVLLSELEEKFPGNERNKELQLELTDAENVFFEKVTAFSGQFITHPGGTILTDEGQVLEINSFSIGETEITFNQWDACVSDGACSYEPDDETWGRKNRPAVNVSFDDIQREFIPWLSQKTGRSYRLPTEAEWELATGAGTQKFSWGDAPFSNQANGSQRFGWPDDGFQASAPVKSFRSNKHGVYDIHGNVSEWTVSCWSPTRGANMAMQNGDCNRLAVKGGSWHSGVKFMETKQRIQVRKSMRSKDRGFRLVLSK